MAKIIDMFLRVLEVAESKMKVPANLVPGEGPVPGLWLCLIVSLHCGERMSSRLPSSS